MKRSKTDTTPTPPSTARANQMPVTVAGRIVLRNVGDGCALIVGLVMPLPGTPEEVMYFGHPTNEDILIAGTYTFTPAATDATKQLHGDDTDGIARRLGSEIWDDLLALIKSGTAKTNDKEQDHDQR